MTDAERDAFNRDQQALKAWKELIANPAWVEVQEMFSKAFDEAAEGLAQIGVTAEKAREHAQAYHLAKKLKGHAAARIDQLQTSVRNFGQKMARE